MTSKVGACASRVYLRDPRRERAVAARGRGRGGRALDLGPLATGRPAGRRGSAAGAGLAARSAFAARAAYSAGTRRQLRYAGIPEGRRPRGHSVRSCSIVTVTNELLAEHNDEFASALTELEGFARIERRRRGVVGGNEGTSLRPSGDDAAAARRSRRTRPPRTRTNPSRRTRTNPSAGEIGSHLVERHGVALGAVPRTFVRGGAGGGRRSAGR